MYQTFMQVQRTREEGNTLVCKDLGGVAQVPG